MEVGQGCGIGCRQLLVQSSASIKQPNRNHAKYKPKQSSLIKTSTTVVASHKHIGDKRMATYKELVLKHANTYGVDPALALAMLSQESGGSTTAVSSKGASGLMQLMPGTAKSLGVTDIFNVDQNVEAGIKYIAQQLKDFGGDIPTALSAYNGGPGATRKNGSKPLPYGETRKYINKIIQQRMPEARKALAGQPYKQGSEGIIDIDAQVQGSSATGSAGAAGTANVPSAIDAAARAYANVNAALGAGLPTPDYQAASDASMAALSSNLDAVRLALSGGQQKLQANADLSNRQVQELLTRNRADPADPNSARSQNATAIGQLQEGLLNTIRAKRQQADASLFSDPGAFITNMLMGNPYAQGQADIEGEIKALRNAGIAVTGEVNDQAQLWAGATQTPADVIKTGMEAQLRLAEIEKDVGIAKADAPLKVASAQTQGLLQQAQAAEAVANAALNASKAGTDSAVAADKQAAELSGYKLQDANNKQQLAILQAMQADPQMAPEQKAKLENQLSFLKTEQDLLRVQTGAKGNLAGLQGQADVATASRNAVLAEAGASTAALDAQTLGQQAANNIIETNAKTDALGFNAKMQAQYNSLAQAEANLKAAVLKGQQGDAEAAAEVAPQRRALEQQKAQLESMRTTAAMETHDAEAGLLKKKIVNESDTYDDAARARAGAQLGYKEAGGVGELNIAQTSPEVQAELAKVASGQSPGSNPYVAGDVLNRVGALRNNAKYPKVGETYDKISIVMQNSLGAEATPANLAKQESATVIALAKQSSLAGRNLDDSALRQGNGSVYGLPKHIEFAAWAGANGKAVGTPASKIFSLPDSAAFEKANTLADMMEALSDSGLSKRDAAEAIASYTTLSIAYNNANNGYAILGLKPAGKEDYAMKYNATLGRSNSANLTSPADILRATTANYTRLIGE